MANFYSYLPLLQQVEGGFQKLPDDPGNYNSLGDLVGTNYGISARFYESIINVPPTEQEMRGITKTEAEQLFRDYFWNAQRANEIVNQSVANTIIDHHVNAGSGALLAQRVLNRHFGYNMAEDNQVGPVTLKALNSVDPQSFVKIYNEARASYYRSLNSTFEAGWLKRLTSFAFEHSGISLIAVLAVATAGILMYHHFKY